MRELPPRARTYVVAVVAVAFLGIGFAALGFHGSPGELLAFVLLYGLATRFATLTSSDMTVSVGFIVALASVAVVGPHAAGVIGVAGALAPVDAPAKLAKRLFNGAQFGLAALLAGGTFAMVLGHDPQHLLLSGAPVGRVLLAAI